MHQSVTGGALYQRAASLIAAIVAMACAAPTWAHSPRLSAEVDGIDAGEKRPLAMSQLDIDVVVSGGIAQTTLHARFSNPTDQVLEGEFVLELPEDAVVTGYALDIGKVMVDGVLVEPRRAKVIYEAKVREGIDPGVAEVSRDNVFTTRVYPIQANAGREIRIQFVAPVRLEGGWVLPLAGPARIGALQISVRAEDLAAPPQVELPADLAIARSEPAGAHALIARGTNVQLTGALRLTQVQPVQALLRAQHATGAGFFQLFDAPIPVDPALAARPQRVRIYWDRSASRRNADLAEEAALLREYLQLAQPGAIDFVAFNSSGVQSELLSSAAALDGVLERMAYRGATSFAVLDQARLAPADLCLLFSDGVVTIDRRDGFAPDCPLMAITTARDADRGYLQRCALRTGGAVLVLRAATRRDVALRLQRQRARIIDVRDARGRPLEFALLEDGAAGWRIVGAAPRDGAVTVRFALPGGRTLVRRYATSTAERRFDGPGALWAAREVALLAAGDDTRARVRELSQAYSVASPALSFLVLENVYDYLEAGITPPSNLPAAMLVEYFLAKTEQAALQEQERAGHLDNLIAAWREQKQWWRERPTARLIAPRARVAQRQDVVSQLSLTSDTDALSQVMVTGSRVQDSGPEIAIELAPWQPERPYLRALDAAADDFARIFSEQERTHGTLPAFYLDVAEWLERRGRRAAALEMLLSALELPQSEATLVTVADRLERYGELDRAVWLHERLCELAPERLQAPRALALALAQRAAKAPRSQARADLARAARLLKQVVMTPGSDALGGMAMVALMDANALVPRLARHGLRPELDPRLVALLDVDLRIVIEWNSPATDLDLSVEEPSGELAIYSNPRTAAGGRLSNDVRDGYGPEEYLLRRAQRGRYRVKVDVYAADRINPNGATTVTARLIRNFGRATQREERLDIELLPDASGAVLIGEFVVGN